MSSRVGSQQNALYLLKEIAVDQVFMAYLQHEKTYWPVRIVTVPNPKSNQKQSNTVTVELYLKVQKMLLNLENTLRKDFIPFQSVYQQGVMNGRKKMKLIYGFNNVSSTFEKAMRKATQDYQKRLKTPKMYLELKKQSEKIKNQTKIQSQTSIKKERSKSCKNKIDVKDQSDSLSSRKGSVTKKQSSKTIKNEKKTTSKKIQNKIEVEISNKVSQKKKTSQKITNNIPKSESVKKASKSKPKAKRGQKNVPISLQLNQSDSVFSSSRSRSRIKQQDLQCLSSKLLSKSSANNQKNTKQTIVNSKKRPYNEIKKDTLSQSRKIQNQLQQPTKKRKGSKAHVSVSIHNQQQQITKNQLNISLCSSHSAVKIQTNPKKINKKSTIIVKQQQSSLSSGFTNRRNNNSNNKKSNEKDSLTIKRQNNHLGKLQHIKDQNIDNKSNSSSSSSSSSILSYTSQTNKISKTFFKKQQNLLLLKVQQSIKKADTSNNIKNNNRQGLKKQNNKIQQVSNNSFSSKSHSKSKKNSLLKQQKPIKKPIQKKPTAAKRGKKSSKKQSKRPSNNNNKKTKVQKSQQESIIKQQQPSNYSILNLSNNKNNKNDNKITNRSSILPQKHNNKKEQQQQSFNKSEQKQSVISNNTSTLIKQQASQQLLLKNETNRSTRNSKKSTSNKAKINVNVKKQLIKVQKIVKSKQVKQSNSKSTSKSKQNKNPLTTLNKDNANNNNNNSSNKSPTIIKPLTTTKHTTNTNKTHNNKKSYQQPSQYNNQQQISYQQKSEQKSQQQQTPQIIQKIQKSCLKQQSSPSNNNNKHQLLLSRLLFDHQCSRFHVLGEKRLQQRRVYVRKCVKKGVNFNDDNDNEQDCQDQFKCEEIKSLQELIGFVKRLLLQTIRTTKIKKNSDHFNLTGLQFILTEQQHEDNTNNNRFQKEPHLLRYSRLQLQQHKNSHKILQQKDQTNKNSNKKSSNLFTNNSRQQKWSIYQFLLHSIYSLLGSWNMLCSSSSQGQQNHHHNKKRGQDRKNNYNNNMIGNPFDKPYHNKSTKNLQQQLQIQSNNSSLLQHQSRRSCRSRNIVSKQPAIINSKGKSSSRSKKSIIARADAGTKKKPNKTPTDKYFAFHNNKLIKQTQTCYTNTNMMMVNEDNITKCHHQQCVILLSAKLFNSQSRVYIVMKYLLEVLVVFINDINMNNNNNNNNQFKRQQQHSKQQQNTEFDIIEQQLQQQQQQQKLSQQKQYLAKLKTTYRQFITYGKSINRQVDYFVNIVDTVINGIKDTSRQKTIINYSHNNNINNNINYQNTDPPCLHTLKSALQQFTRILQQKTISLSKQITILQHQQYNSIVYVGSLLSSKNKNRNKQEQHQQHYNYQRQHQLIQLQQNNKNYDKIQQKQFQQFLRRVLKDTHLQQQQQKPSPTNTKSSMSFIQMQSLKSQILNVFDQLESQLLMKHRKEQGLIGKSK